MDTSLGGKQASTFKTFPEFSKLTIQDRRKYEKIIEKYPPVSDFAFASLMVWWNFLDTCAVSQLNGNLVISYWFPGVEKHSGLAVLGTHKIDETICDVFDYQRSDGQKPQLVHVPEFVLEHIQYPDMFICKEERDFDEYVYRLDKFYPLKRAISYRRRRVNKFLSAIDEDRIEMCSLDLSVAENRHLLLNKAQLWQKAGKLNDIVQLEKDAIKLAITHADAIGMENACLFIDNEIHAFCLYQLPSDKQYAIFNHARFNNEIPRTLDYAIFAFARWLAEQGIKYVNLESDIGIPFIRMFKLALGPENYFRKYTIEPAS